MVASETGQRSAPVGPASTGGLTKLAELTVGQNQRAEGPQPLNSLAAMLLRRRLVDGRVGKRCVASGDLLSLPDEVLEEIAFVLRQEEHLGLLDHDAEILDEVLAFAGQLARRRAQC